MKVSIGHFIAGASIASAFFYASNQDANYKVNWSGKTISTNGIVLDGTAYVSATELVRELGVTVSVDQSGKVIAFGQPTGTATTGSPRKPASNIEWGKELVTNGSFESGNGIKSYYDDQVTIPGWQITGRAQVGLYGKGAFTVPEEQRPENCGNKYYVGKLGSPIPPGASSQDQRFPQTTPACSRSQSSARLPTGQ